MSPLQVAAHKAHVEKLKRIGVPSDVDLQRPLGRAVVKGQRLLAEFLIETRADPLAFVPEKTATKVHKPEVQEDLFLNYAVAGGHLPVAELLINARAEVNKPGWRGTRPLHWASAGGPVELVNYLLKQRASVADDVSPGFGGVRGSALHVSVYFGMANVSRLLLARKANVVARDVDGAQPIHKGAAGGHLEILQLLMDASADPDAQDWSGKRPVYFAKLANHPSALRFLQSANNGRRGRGEL